MESSTGEKQTTKLQTPYMSQECGESDILIGPLQS
jgi:hypothetical protein